jgi:hypothetical protein
MVGHIGEQINRAGHAAGFILERTRIGLEVAAAA